MTPRTNYVDWVAAWILLFLYGFLSFAATTEYFGHHDFVSFLFPAMMQSHPTKNKVAMTGNSSNTAIRLREIFLADIDHLIPSPSLLMLLCTLLRRLGYKSRESWHAPKGYEFLIYEECLFDKASRTVESFPRKHVSL